MIRYKRKGLRYGEVWFGETVPSEPNVDIVLLRDRPEPLAGERSSDFLTLTNDLTVEDSNLFRLLGSTNRYKVKRAETKDGLQYSFFREPRAYIEPFCEFFDVFAQDKLLALSHREGLSAACDAGRLALSAVSRDGEHLVWHAYIAHERTAVLLHSASHHRAQDKDLRAVIGRANRWAHWRDMLTFKTLEFHRYDWGGMFEDESHPERAGINNFKREFGGTPERNYNCELALTTKGRAYLAARDAFRTIRVACAGFVG